METVDASSHVVQKRSLCARRLHPSCHTSSRRRVVASSRRPFVGARASIFVVAFVLLAMAPSNAQKNALAKAKRGIVASGAMSAKGGFDPQMHKSREMACPHCERIFKQQDRLKQHIARQHADAVEEKSESESSAVKSKSGASSAKARLIIEERERAKEAAARERREGDPNAKNASTPFTRMSCKFPSTILREFVQKQKEFKSPVFKAKEEKTAAGETAAGERGGAC